MIRGNWSKIDAAMVWLQKTATLKLEFQFYPGHWGSGKDCFDVCPAPRLPGALFGADEAPQRGDNPLPDSLSPGCLEDSGCESELQNLSCEARITAKLYWAPLSSCQSSERLTSSSAGDLRLQWTGRFHCIP